MDMFQQIRKTHEERSPIRTGAEPVPFDNQSDVPPSKGVRSSRPSTVRRSAKVTVLSIRHLHGTVCDRE